MEGDNTIKPETYDIPPYVDKTDITRPPSKKRKRSR